MDKLENTKSNKLKNSYKAERKELVSLNVYNVGYEKCLPSFEWGPGVRDHYLIHYCINGQGSYKVSGKTYKLTAGDCFLVYPFTEISYKADNEDPWEYTWVGFAGTDAELILKASDFTRENPVLFNIENGDTIRKQILSIYEARGNTFTNDVEMTGRLYTMLASIMKASKQTISGNSYSGYVSKAIEYISANYSYPITVENIASYVGVSRSHLFRSFENVLEISPKEYLTDFRLKESIYLLTNTNLSITSIANSVGFDNSMYFSKAFRKLKGMSPKEYRNICR